MRNSSVRPSTRIQRSGEWVTSDVRAVRTSVAVSNNNEIKLQSPVINAFSF